MSFFAGIFQVFWSKNQNSYYTRAPTYGWFGVGLFDMFFIQKTGKHQYYLYKPAKFNCHIFFFSFAFFQRH